MLLFAADKRPAMVAVDTQPVAEDMLVVADRRRASFVADTHQVLLAWDRLSVPVGLDSRWGPLVADRLPDIRREPLAAGRLPDIRREPLAVEKLFVPADRIPLVGDTAADRRLEGIAAGMAFEPDIPHRAAVRDTVYVVEADKRSEVQPHNLADTARRAHPDMVRSAPRHWAAACIAVVVFHLPGAMVVRSSAMRSDCQSESLFCHRPLQQV